MIHAHRTDEIESLAAAYALGALAPDEARAFESHLADDGCGVCRREVETMRVVCGELAVAPEPTTPSPAVRARVLAEAVAPSAPSAFSYLLAADGTWELLSPGVERKTLAALDAATGSWSSLVRMAPGASLRPHAHDRTEHCYVIAGDVDVDGVHLHAGDFHLAPRGTRHDAVRSDDGCLLLIIGAA